MLQVAALYLTYCVVVLVVCASAYCWLDRRNRGVLVPPAELRLLSEFRKHRDCFEVYRQLPADCVAKGEYGRRVHDLIGEYKYERDMFWDSWIEASESSQVEALRADKAEDSLVEAKQDADRAWQIAQNRYLALEQARAECRVLSAKLDDRDEEIDDLKRRVGDVDDCDDGEGFGYPPGLLEYWYQKSGLAQPSNGWTVTYGTTSDPS